MGSGKTSNCIKLNIETSTTVIFVTNRITLTDFISTMFPEFKKYNELDYNIFVRDGDKIIC